MPAPLTAASTGHALDPCAAMTTRPIREVLPPLNVSGLVVRKADLVAALRIYVPQLGDIAALDGERFLLTLGGADSESVRSEAS